MRVSRGEVKRTEEQVKGIKFGTFWEVKFKLAGAQVMQQSMSKMNRSHESRRNGSWKRKYSDTANMKQSWIKGLLGLEGQCLRITPGKACSFWFHQKVKVKFDWNFVGIVGTWPGQPLHREASENGQHPWNRAISSWTSIVGCHKGFQGSRINTNFLTEMSPPFLRLLYTLL